ncbi:MAG: NUDIX domain-containing protein [Oscillospiraceae bacterium]|nr:NUDIX domain-containing protein [Oscillospiraceae bacterium]
MILGMPGLAGLTDAESAAIAKRLGLKDTGSKKAVKFSLSMSNEEKEHLLSRAEAEGLAVLPEVSSVEELEAAVLWVNLWRNRMCEPDELWDVYDAEGNLTGKTHLRAVPLKPDEYHLCVHIWLENSKGEFLLTKRSENKSMPGLWESTGGSVTAGEDSFTAALREVEEETGIILDPSAGQFLFRYSGLSFHCDVWLFRQEFDLSKVKLLEGETCDCMAADRAKILELLKNDEFVPYEYIEAFLK